MIPEKTLKKLGVKKIGTSVCNAGTKDKIRTQTFSLELSADILGPEWNTMSEKDSTEVLYMRYRYHLDVLFQDLR